ncbi:sodium:alanine symporter family protein, partial [Xanthomonas citri pv. citri]|nr:sodium:alanine symporter family protein [Xanthomonas citri pv. citri]
LVALLGIGTFPQVNGITHSLESTFDIPVVFSSIVLTLVVTSIILGGVKRISKIASIIVPFMAVAYVIASVSVLIMNAEKVPDAIVLIVHAAFNPEAALGGAFGFTVMQAIQLGVARGIFSN